MNSWLEFLVLVFWISVSSFSFNYSNFLYFFFFSEFVWLNLYCLTISLSIMNEDLNLIGLSFFFLGLAGLEFSVGFMLLIIMKKFKVSLNIFENDKKINFFFENKKSIFFF